MSRNPLDRTQPEVFGVHHTAYRCRDAATTCAFYEGVLGFPLVQALHIDRQPTTGEPVDYLHIFFDIGSHDPAQPNHIAFFELDIPRETDSFEFKAEQSGFDLHLAMQVKDHADLLAWRARLQARGVKVVGPIDHEICSSIYFTDPDGYKLEFTAQNAQELAVFARHRATAHDSLRAWNARKAAKAPDQRSPEEIR